MPRGQMLAGCVLALWLNKPAGYRSFQGVRRVVGMYLIHFLPMLVGHRVAARLPWTGARPFVAFAAAGSMAAAWVLAVTVERPFIRLGRKWSGRLLNPKVAPADPIPGTPTPA